MRWSSALLLSASVGALRLPDNLRIRKRWDGLAERHAWDAVPKGWTYHSETPSDYQMTMHIGLKQHRLGDLLTSLDSASDPSTSKYGSHLSKADVESLAAPHSSTQEVVFSWLSDHGVERKDIKQSGGGDWLTLQVSVPQAETLLNAQYAVYRHASSLASDNQTHEYVVRTLKYSLPEAVNDHITVISPTTYFGTWKSMRATSFVDAEEDITPNNLQVGDLYDNDIPSVCALHTTPDCLRKLYNIWYKPQATSLNRLGIVGYLNEFGNRQDLQTFLQEQMPSALGASYNTTLVNGGGDDQSKPGREANLDIQYAFSISYPTPNVYYSVGGSPPFIPDSRSKTNTNEPYLEWLQYMLALPDEELPKTISTSYGDDEQTVPRDYQIAVCNMFAQLGARGVSVLFSSGDVGVGGADCMTNDGSNVKRFQPGFPGSCPYVTTVGSTTDIPERTVKFSSGGFSNTFSRPAYQDTAVPGYLAALGGMHAGLYNTSGRGIPDISAQGTKYRVILGGKAILVGGTSASTPVVAAMIALINDHRIANGKPTLGFLNPILYSTEVSRIFNDITEGSNPGCGTIGFPAREGWDPATGLGTPDFLRLLAVLG
ncbi:hypothetical protein ONZ45_g19303 [Pleurotus djamor]|nr:hypothetical protein ONZ45_g19303 [Pleurotus djamor]